jgi:geranylgeranyl diphosphate synthase type II
MDSIIARYRDRIEAALVAEVDSRGAPQRLRDAMKHSLLAGGKRLRPSLVLAWAEAAGAAVGDAMPAAIAVEYIHTYSLIHDDLPAIDDDDVRRGVPTLHRAFDEATAILAGDALLTDAFAVVAAAPRNASLQVRELATAAGSGGMVGGQVDDVAGVRTLDELTFMHARKTGCLFVASCAMGALAAGAAADVVAKAREFGARLGLAFQIADDVIDVESGRARDAANHKVTFTTLLGVDAARARARAEADVAAGIARELARDDLEQLAHFAAERHR